MERRDAEHTEAARTLRKRMNSAERRLWRHLQNNGNAFHWRRQHPLAGYCLDFYCDEVRLCVEVDGGVHEEFKQDRDEQRDRKLEELSILTLRFTNYQVGEEIDVVLERIDTACYARAGLFPHIRNRAKD